MPIHDWTKVEAGIFHDFHQAWITEIKRALNDGVLPEEYYALAEQVAGGLGPDVLALQTRSSGDTSLTAEAELAYYRRKRNVIAVHHVSGDDVVAIIEIVSPGNKSSQNAIRSFVEKACQLIDRHIHLVVLDLHPPGPRDPQGIHGVIWKELTDEDYVAPAECPLTLVSYESSLRLRAFVEPVAVGACLPDLPLFLEPGAHVVLPLERTYLAAYQLTPRRWRSVLEG